VRGADRYPGPVVSQARGHQPKNDLTTSLVGVCEPSSHIQARASHFHTPWCPWGHNSCVAKQGRAIGRFRPGGCLGQWSQVGTQCLIPLTRGARPLFPCPFIVPWSDACPGCQTGRRPKASHIHPDLRDHQCRFQTVYPRDGILQVHDAGNRQGRRRLCCGRAAALCMPAAVGPGVPPRGMRDARKRTAGRGDTRLAEQYGLS
jgi:hypothetical protein